MTKEKSLTAAALASSLEYIRKDANKIKSQGRTVKLKFCLQSSLGNAAKPLRETEARILRAGRRCRKPGPGVHH